ncbi:MAG: hypothetical protein V3V97_01355 [Hyphomicrobiaceae bacterium]
MKRVIIVSAYESGNTTEAQYAQDLLHDALARGESPLHGSSLLAAKLKSNQEDGRLAVDHAETWLEASSGVVVGHDLGMTAGMSAVIVMAKKWGMPVTFRSLDDWVLTGERMDPEVRAN